MNFNKKKSLGFLEGWLSIGINTSLFGLKFWAGNRIGSLSMKADAWHTLADTLTSIVVIFGFWISARPADEKHGFGHGRAESIVAVVIGTLLTVVGAAFLKESIVRIVKHQAVTFATFAILIFLISAVIKEALAQFSFWAGRKANSKALFADAWHHRSDAIASALIVIGALLGKTFWWIDGVLGIGVSLLILYAAYTIVRPTSSYLLGESFTRHQEKQILDIVRSTDPSFNNLHHLHVHNYGDNIEITAHIKLPSNMSVEEAHEIATKAEAILKKQLKAEVTIHIEPSSEKTPSKK